MKCVTYETGILEVIHSLLRADHSSRGMVPSVVCLECGREAWIMRRLWTTRGCGPLGAVVPARKEEEIIFSKLNTKCS